MDTTFNLSQEEIWERIVEFVESGEVIPVLGPGIITFGQGKDETLLYPWLLGELAKEFQLPTTPPSLHSLVCALGGTRCEMKVRMAIKRHLRPLREMEPSPLMKAIASLPNCRTFFTLGCDLLFENALAFCHPSGVKIRPQVWNAFKDKGDLPKHTGSAPVLGYLFGNSDSTNDGSYNLWDADALEFAFSLQQMRDDSKTYPHLVDVFSEKHLLFLGANMSDWALRFLLRILRNEKLSKSTQQELFLTERDDGRGDDPIAFFAALNSKIHFQHDDPLSFARRLCKEVQMRNPAPVSPPPSVAISQSHDLGKNAAFISYDHRDAEAASRIAEALREAGCRVWIDQSRLKGGFHVNDQIDRALSPANCKLFISVISTHTVSKVSGYVHTERISAVKASKFFGGRPYYVPVIVSEGISDTPENEPYYFWNPLSDLGPVTKLLAPDGNLAAKDAQDIANMLRNNCDE